MKVGMRATRGLMASMGAATCLILAGTIVLSLVSGVVAFRGWPGAGVTAGGEQAALLAQARADAVSAPTVRLRVPSATAVRAALRTSTGSTGVRAVAGRRAAGTATASDTRGATGSGASGLAGTAQASSSTPASTTPSSAPKAGDPVRQLGTAVDGTVGQAGQAAGDAVDLVVPGAGAVAGQVTGAVGQTVSGATGVVGQAVDRLGRTP